MNKFEIPIQAAINKKIVRKTFLFYLKIVKRQVLPNDWRLLVKSDDWIIAGWILTRWMNIQYTYLPNKLYCKWFDVCWKNIIKFLWIVYHVKSLEYRIWSWVGL